MGLMNLALHSCNGRCEQHAAGGWRGARRQQGTHLHVFSAIAVAVHLVRNALAGCPAVRLLPVARHRRADHDHDPGVVAQLLQAQVERCVLPRLYQQLIDHSPEHRHCTTGTC